MYLRCWPTGGTRNEFSVEAFSVDGTGGGAGLFRHQRINDAQAKLLIGVIVIALLAVHLWRRRKGGEIQKIWVVVCADHRGVGGIHDFGRQRRRPLDGHLPAGDATAEDGIYGHRRGVFHADESLQGAVHDVAGAGKSFSLTLNIWLAPAVLIGALMGKKLLAHIDQRLFENIALILAGAAGLKFSLEN